MSLLLSGVLLNFLPWWVIAPVALVVSIFFYTKPVFAFFAAFLGTGILWGGYAAILDAKNNGVFSSQFGQIFNGLSSHSLIMGTAIMGALVSGLSALTGSLFRKLFFKEPLNESK